MWWKSFSATVNLLLLNFRYGYSQIHFNKGDNAFIAKLFFIVFLTSFNFDFHWLIDVCWLMISLANFVFVANLLRIRIRIGSGFNVLVGAAFNGLVGSGSGLDPDWMGVLDPNPDS
jgi:hypothetical protein